MLKTTLALGLAASVVLTAVPAQAEPSTKVVYGWAKRSGSSAIIVIPHKAHLTELGESGILAWELVKKTGDPVKLTYDQTLTYRQGNRACGKQAAGAPFDKWSKKGYGLATCAPKYLNTLLKKGRIAVRVVYDPTEKTAIKVTELRLP